MTESSTWLSYPRIRPMKTESRFSAASAASIAAPRRICLFRNVAGSMKAASRSTSAMKSSTRIPAVLRLETCTRFSFGRKKQVNRIGTASGCSFRFRISHRIQ